MPRALKVCAQPGCATPTAKSYCTQHTRERDKARGTTTQRGYGAAHQRARQQAKPAVEAGQVLCARCRQPIAPGEPWQLDHSDEDRTKYLGPSHKLCNLSAAGKRSHLFT